MKTIPKGRSVFVLVFTLSVTLNISDVDGKTFFKAGDKYFPLNDSRQLSDDQSQELLAIINDTLDNSIKDNHDILIDIWKSLDQVPNVQKYDEIMLSILRVHFDILFKDIREKSVESKGLVASESITNLGLLGNSSEVMKQFCQKVGKHSKIRKDGVLDAFLLDVIKKAYDEFGCQKCDKCGRTVQNDICSGCSKKPSECDCDFLDGFYITCTKCKGSGKVKVSETEFYTKEVSEKCIYCRGTGNKPGIVGPRGKCYHCKGCGKTRSKIKAKRYVPRVIQCSDCSGTGKKKTYVTLLCSHCRGRGRTSVTKEESYQEDGWRRCSHCNGGRIGGRRCSVCLGKGGAARMITKTRPTTYITPCEKCNKTGRAFELVSSIANAVRPYFDSKKMYNIARDFCRKNSIPIDDLKESELLQKKYF